MNEQQWTLMKSLAIHVPIQYWSIINWLNNYLGPGNIFILSNVRSCYEDIHHLIKFINVSNIFV